MDIHGDGENDEPLLVANVYGDGSDCEDEDDDYIDCYEECGTIDPEEYC